MAIKSVGFSCAYFTELIETLNKLVAEAVISSGDTVSQVITQLTTERDAQ